MSACTTLAIQHTHTRWVAAVLHANNLNLPLIRIHIEDSSFNNPYAFLREFYLVTGVEGFWEGLAICRDVAETTPADRWDADFHYSQQGAKSGTYARFGAYCADVAAFDAAYFRLPASEALALDPHTRLLLTLAQVRLLSRAL